MRNTVLNDHPPLILEMNTVSDILIQFTPFFFFLSRLYNYAKCAILDCLGMMNNQYFLFTVDKADDRAPSDPGVFRGAIQEHEGRTSQVSVVSVLGKNSN